MQAPTSGPSPRFSSASEVSELFSSAFIQGSLVLKRQKYSVNVLNSPRLAGYYPELPLSGLTQILDVTGLDFLTWLLFTHLRDVP